MNKQKENKKNQLLRTAFPATPAVDNYNQIFTPYPGLCRLEHYALKIFTSMLVRDADTMDLAINQSVELIEKIDNYIKNLDHEEAQIIL
jgi:hypothetical protein